MNIETGSIEYDDDPEIDHRPRLLAALDELVTLEIQPKGLAVVYAGRIMTLFPTERDEAPAWDAVADVNADDVEAGDDPFVVGRGASIRDALDACAAEADAIEGPDRGNDD